MAKLCIKQGRLQGGARRVVPPRPVKGVVAPPLVLRAITLLKSETEE